MGKWREYIENPETGEIIEVTTDGMEDACGVCGFYVGNKTFWPISGGEYVRTDGSPGCSKRVNHHTRFADPPCEIYERCNEMEGLRLSD